MACIQVRYVFCALFWLAIIASTVRSQNEDASFWHKYGENQLKRVLEWSHAQTKAEKAKNVIIFIGDGMGMTTITAGRIFKGQQQGNRGEEQSLVWDLFPSVGLAKTYNVDKQVPDSAGTATAIFTGVKTQYGVLGMDNTTSSTNPTIGKLTSIMDWAQNAGKRTGVVTSTRITHATPAALYSNIHDRDWECDSEIPIESKEYKDIARQLVEDSPGNKFNVIFGGGKYMMGSNESVISTPGEIKFSGSTEDFCERLDRRNLIQDWLNIEPKTGRVYVKNRDELMAADVNKIDHLLGLFNHNHLSYAMVRPKLEPTLAEMTEKAIRVLERPNSNGFVLMVEGGRIDHAHHQNYARAAMHELVAFDTAIQRALNITNSKDTLIIVTADHSHAMTLNGYPKRGNDILGFANKTKSVEPYETLTYANGPGFNFHRANKTQEDTARHGTWIKVEDLAPEVRESPLYQHAATFPKDDETHGGEDIPVYAFGPGSGLIRGVFEQSYIAYAVSYASCIGPATSLNENCYRNGNNSAQSGTVSSYKIHSLNVKYFVISFSILVFTKCFAL